MTLKLQLELLSTLKTKYTFEKYAVGQEYLCTYDIGELWDEYSVKLRKCLFFLEKYYAGMRNEILIHAEMLKKDDIGTCPSRNMEEAIFYFAAIILRRFGSREYVESEIRNLRGKMELLRRESIEFRNQSEAAILNLRQRELTLDQYLKEVRWMQDLAEGMFRQSTQEMALLWVLERSARVKEPTLEEYLKMCEQDKNKQEEKENEKELLN